MAATVEQLTNLIRKHNGNISAVARALRLSRTAIYDRIHDSDELKAVLTESRETIIDEAENQLGKKVKKGDIAAIIFTLKSIGKHRGWVERQEVEQSGAVSITVKYGDDGTDGTPT